MSFLPPELSSLASVFRISVTSENTVASLEILARLHGFALAALRRIRGGWVEEYFLKEDSYIKGYAATSEALATERGRIQSFLDQVRATPGLLDEPVLYPSGRIQLATTDRTVDMFPFAEVRADHPSWLTRCRRGVLIYSDAQGNQTQIDASDPKFEQAIEALLEFGWYRLVVKLLEGPSDSGRKHFENKLYSALCFLACDFYKARRYQEAVQEFEKAMKIKANMPQLFYNLALSYARVNAFDSAIQLLNQLQRIKPGQAKTFELLADFHFQAGELERAATLYHRALELAENKQPLLAKINKLEERNHKPRPAVEQKKEEGKEERFLVQSYSAGPHP